MFCWNADASIVLFQPCSLLAGFCRKQCLFTSTNSRLGVLLIFLRLYLGTASAAFSTFTSFLGTQLEAVWKLPWLGLTLQLQAWLALETSSEGSFLHLERYVIIGVATWTFWDNALVKEFYGQPSCKRQCRGIVDFCVCENTNHCWGGSSRNQGDHRPSLSLLFSYVILLRISPFSIFSVIFGSHPKLRKQPGFTCLPVRLYMGSLCCILVGLFLIPASSIVRFLLPCWGWKNRCRCDFKSNL